MEIAHVNKKDKEGNNLDLFIYLIDTTEDIIKFNIEEERDKNEYSLEFPSIGIYFEDERLIEDFLNEYIKILLEIQKRVMEKENGT